MGVACVMLNGEETNLFTSNTHNQQNTPTYNNTQKLYFCQGHIHFMLPHGASSTFQKKPIKSFLKYEKLRKVEISFSSELLRQ